MFTCKYCQGQAVMYMFTPFKNSHYKGLEDAKYHFHIKKVCANCHRFNGFEKQTDELMKELKGNMFVHLDLEKRPVHKRVEQLSIT